jgi:3-oxoacyl-[acyl-carrier-protein] synthase II
VTTPLLVTGWGAVSAAGVGADDVRDALSAGAAPPADVTGLYPDPMPAPAGYACVDFDVRALLGRKGTGSLDRATAFAVVACGEAIADSGLVVDNTTRDRIGIVLGTTLGSFRSSSDYSRETLVHERPYLVNPLLFPNTVMNCATGQSAIRHGLRGVNSTVAGGRTGFLAALRYAANALRRGYADAMLVGAVEEFTPHTAWMHHHLGRTGLPGEGAAVFVLQRDAGLAAAGRSGSAVPAGQQPQAVVAAVASGYRSATTPGAATTALAACIRRALADAGVRPGEVQLVATGEVSDPGADAVEEAAAREVFNASPAERVTIRQTLGDCGAATGAMHLAALLTRWQARSTGPAVLAGWSPDGAVAAAVVTEYRDVRADRC